MSLDPLMQDFMDRAKAAAKDIEPFGKSVLFDFGDDGKVFADATSAPVTFEHAKSFDKRANCMVKTKIKTLQKLIKGDLDPMAAIFSGRLKVSGEMGAALELAKKMRATNA